MSGFISALIKQRRDAKKAGPDTSGRLKEIIDIIRKYNYDDGITPEIVVGIVQDLGPTFVKIGQIASQQAEYIPVDYADALAKLRSSVAPMDIETVHAQIEKHLGKPVNELFASFDEKPSDPHRSARCIRRSSSMAPWLPSRCVVPVFEADRQEGEKREYDDNEDCHPEQSANTEPL